MTTSRDIALNVIGDISSYQRKLAEIPGFTDRQAARAALQLQKQMNKAQVEATKDARRAAAQAAKEWERQNREAQRAIEAEAARAAQRSAEAWERAGRLAASVISLAAIQRTVTGVRDLMQSTVDMRNEITTAAAQTAMATDTLAALRHAADGAGNSFSAMQPGLRAMPKLMREAQSGTSAAARAWAELGVDIEDSEGRLRDADDVVRETITALQGLDSEVEASALGRTLFSRSWAEISASLGDVPIDTFAAQVRTLGLDVTPAAARATDEWSRAMAELQGALKGALADVMDLVDAGSFVDDLTLGFVYMKELVIGGLRELGSSLSTVADMYRRFYTGDFKGSYEAFQSLRQASQANADAALEVAYEFWKARNAIRDAETATRALTDAGEEAVEVSQSQAAAARDHAEAERAREAALQAQLGLRQVAAQAARDQLTAEEALRLAYEEQLEKIWELEVASEAAAGADAARAAVRARYERDLAALQAKYAAEDLARREAAHEAEIRRMDERREREEREERERVGRMEERLAHTEFFYEQATTAAQALLAVEERRVHGLLAAEMEALDDIQARRDALHAQALAQTDERAQAMIEAEVAKLDAELDAAQKATAARRAAAMRLHAANKVVAIAEIAMNTASAVMRAFALFGPPPSPAGIAAAAAAGTAGGVQAGIVAAQKPPQFHAGFPGFTRDPREYVASLLPGEAVLNQRATSRLGRERIEQLNATGSTTSAPNSAPASGGGSGELVATIEWQGRSVAQLVAHQVERGRGGSLSTRLRRAEGPRGIRPIYGGL